MRILLFGEFSGFMNCLKDGFAALGHDVFLASDGDGFKNFPSDLRWDQVSGIVPPFIETLPRVNGFLRYSKLFLQRDKLRGYDVVLIITPHIFPHFYLNKTILNYIINNNTKIYLSGAGMLKGCFDFWYNSKTKYRDYCEGSLLDNPNYSLLFDTKFLDWENELFDKIEGYIPIWYEYAEPYRNHPKLKKTIRIPIALGNFEYKPNVLTNGRIVFYHGISRLCKGVRFIQPAFDKMQKFYGEEAEFICADKLPFSEYIQVINRANVIVDDANSYSIAMNGLFSLLKGKLVMGGAEPIADKELGIENNPVYNINPDVDQICEVIKDIIDNKDQIEELGKKGSEFVTKYHNSIDIAQQYIDLWGQDNKN